MSQSRMLYQLQRTDLDIEARMRRVREIKALLQDDEALQRVHARVDGIQAELRPQETRVTDLTLELETVDSQAKQLSQRLYGGGVSNFKELEDIQDKIAERKRRHATLEDRMLETMIAVEELQASLAEANEELGRVEAEWASQTQALGEEHQRLRAEIKTLKAEREALAAQISAGNLDMYQQMRATKQGRAVASLKGDLCSGCGVGQTSNIVQAARQDQEIVLCASCGRILVAL
jgi:predicted  nucleic acid-binding Zn-ribbon protein